MEVIEIFQVLGIEETKDERAIKNAYREKLAVTNPEDNPEGFKRLRTAYEEACVYAKQSEEEAGTLDERDESPSGLWVEKAEAIYKNILFRQDVEKWEELFDDDVFLSLEEEENCRFKLLRFMMDHFKFPTAVWKLFDEKMNLKTDGQKLREMFPGDFINYVLSRCERGEDVEFSQFEGEPEAEYDLFLQYYDRCWNALQENQYEQAAEYIKNADDLQISHPVIEVCRAHLYVAQEKVEDAIAVLKNLRDRYPTDAMICYNAAEIMWNHDRKEDAAEIYAALKEENEKHYMANVRLTEWNYLKGQYEDAKKCAEKVLSHGADDDFMELLAKVNAELEKGFEEHYYAEKDVHSALELGWCYLQDGKVFKGIRLVESINKEDVPEDRVSEYRGLLTKLYMEATEYEQALNMANHWEEALQKRLQSDESEEDKEKDRDRLRQYHVIRMQCFRAFGDMRSTRKPEECRADYEKAIEEIDNQLNGTSQDIGLLLEKAQIYMEMEEFEKSLETTRIIIEEHQVYAAYATEIEVYRRQWDATGVVQSARQCINYFPSYIRAYEHMAKVFLDLKRPDDLQTILNEAKENNIESCILDAYRYQMDHEVPDTEELDKRLQEFRNKYFVGVENGDMKFYEEGLPIITEYLYWYPGTYMLVERGLFHRAARHYDEAKKDFEKALAENPRQPYALNGLSFVYKYLGDFEQALLYNKRAVRYRDPDMTTGIYSDQANLYSLLGDYKAALKAYQKHATGKGHDLRTIKPLALHRARTGEFYQAQQTIYNAYKKYPYNAYDEVADIYQMAGNEKETTEILGKWSAQLPLDKSLDAETKADFLSRLHIRMAWQHVLFGDGQKAVEYYEKVLKYKENIVEQKWEICGTLSDAVFMCIITGNVKMGQKLAARLKSLIKEAESAGTSVYINQDKQLAQTKFHAAYYDSDWNAEDMKKILEAGDRSEICHFCDYCICKELEAAWLLWLIRCGQKKEALERLEKDLEKQPLDEYQRAIKHMLEIGVFDGQEEQLKALASQNNGQNAQENTGFVAKLKGLFAKK